MTTPQDNIPYGFCHCGCGQKTNLRKGHPSRYIGHHHPQSKDGIERIRKAHTTHGHSAFGTTTKTYNTWRAMMSRCFDPACVKYPTYGACGVTVCERWKLFDNFLADMGDRPEGRTIDRYPDNAGNYEPGNCRWATPKEQSANRRKRGHRRPFNSV